MTPQEIEDRAKAWFYERKANPPKGCPMPTWEEQPEKIKEAHRVLVRAALAGGSR